MVFEGLGNGSAMIPIILSEVGQFLRTGRSFQLLLVFVLGILITVSYFLGRRGKLWEIRPLEALEAIWEGVGRCAEMGRPVMILPGISGLGSPETLAGLTIFGEVAQRSAEIGVTPISSASSSEVILASEAIIRSAFTSAGKPELYATGKYVRWFGGDQFSYAVGAAGQVIADKPGMCLQIGYFLFDVIVAAETGSRVGSIQIGGTLGSLNMLAMFCDYVFIGEEIYAASASISRDKMATATIAGQDWVKLIVIVLLIVGAILGLAGNTDLYKLMGM